MSKIKWPNLLIIGGYLTSCFLIYHQKPPISSKTINTSIATATNHTNQNIAPTQAKISTSKISQEQILATLSIPKINLNQSIYPFESKHNNVEENVTILQGSILPGTKNSIVFLAAHSGTGDKALFNELDKLQLKDKLILNYQNEIYTYKIVKIEEQVKKGSIQLPQNTTDQLILTTCSKQHKDKQLVIISNIEK